MKKQKTISLLLSAALMLPLYTAVFAAETPKTLDESNAHAEFNISSSLELPTIKVNIGNVGDIITNPYHMDVTQDSKVVNDQVISAPTKIESQSTIALNLTATPTVDKGTSSVEISSSSTKGKATKAIFLQYNTAVITEVTDTNKFGTSTTIGTNGETLAGKYTGEDTNVFTPKHVPILEESNKKTAEIILPAASAQNDSTVSTWGAFKITGDCSGTGWTSPADEVSIKVIFDIAPVIPTT